MATYYLDPTAANHGDGSDPAQAGAPGGVGAFNTLQGVTLAANDEVWVRRAARGSVGTVCTADFITSVDGLKIIGWPLSGDDHYAARPAAGQALWDADVDTHAVLKVSAVGVEVSFTGSVEVHRVEFYSTGSHTLNLSTLGGSGKTVKIRTVRVYSDIQTNLSTSNGLLEIQGVIDAYDVTLDGQYTASSLNYGLLLATAESGSFIRKVSATCSKSHASGPVMTFAGTGLVLEDVAFQWAGTPADWISPPIALTGTAMIARRLTIDATGATVSTGAKVRVLPSAGGIADQTLRIYDLKLINCSFETQVAADYLEIAEWTESTLNTTAITFYCRTVVVGKSALNGANLATYTFGSTNDPCLLLSRGITFPNQPALAGRSRWYSVDHAGNAGDFYCRGEGMQATSTSVARTGGSAYSLKVEPYDAGANSLHRGLPVFGPDERQAVLLYLVAGTYTVTLYGAHKNFTNDYGNAPTKDHLVFEVRGLGTLARLVEYSIASADPIGEAVASDASAWTGDTGLTAFKLTAQITTTRDGLVLCDLRAGWKLAEGGLVYVDPLPVAA